MHNIIFYSLAHFREGRAWCEAMFFNHKSTKILDFISEYFSLQGGWSAILAGLAAGSVSILDHPDRRRTLSLFVLARALGALVVTLHQRGHLPNVPYFATVIFAVCESLIIVCMTHFPELLPRGYYRSILNWSMYYTNEKLEVRKLF